jgi:hypothetical protein
MQKNGRNPRSVTKLPLLNMLGYGAKNIKKFRLINNPSTTVEWMEDGYESVTDTYTGQTQLTNDTTTTTLTVAHGGYFQIGDVIQFNSDSDLSYVSDVSTNTLTITRGFGGTTSVTHASAGTIYRRFRARVEGADASNSPSTTVTTNYNYSQILQKTISVTGTRQVVTQYGIANEYDREVEKAFKELLRDLERVAFYGQRSAGSSSAARSAGGLGAFITTNVTTLSGSPALTQKNIEDAVQNAWSYGGEPDTIVCGAWAQKKIRDMYSPYVRTERKETLGGVIIDKLLVPPVGEISLLVDRWCPASTVYIIDSKKVGWVPIREFFDEKLAKTGDSEQGQVIGEYSFVCQNEKAHAIVTGFSTTK